MLNKNHFIVKALTIFLIALLISCSNKKPTVNKGELLKTDREFSKLSEKEGMHRAFLNYFANDGVLLKDNSLPIIGKMALEKSFSKSSDSSFVLTWEPIYEKIASSGELGYTYGTYALTLKESKNVKRGTYVTIWEKQNDGDWKFVLDSGNDGLGDIE